MNSQTLAVAVLVGIGGTVLLGLWALLLQRSFGIPATNWRMVGRWLGHVPNGRFVQPNLPKAQPVAGEAAIGGSETPKPNITRLKSFVSHGVFGLGMYGTALLLAGTFPPSSPS